MSYTMSCEFGKSYRFLAGAGCVGYFVLFSSPLFQVSTLANKVEQ